MPCPADLTPSTHFLRFVQSSECEWIAVLRVTRGTHQFSLDFLSKWLEISLTATSHGFESHPLRQRKPHKPSVYAVFPYLYCKKESSVYIGEQIRNSHRDLFPNFNLCFELAKNERAPKKQIAQRQNFLISCRNVIASLKNKVFMI